MSGKGGAREEQANWPTPDVLLDLPGAIKLTTDGIPREAANIC
jgi:hypothetical protein